MVEKAKKFYEEDEFIIQITPEEAVWGGDIRRTMPNWITCDVCNGNGCKEGSKVEICKDCNGTGQSNNSSDSPFGLEEVFNNFFNTCNTCNGIGKIYELPCPKCNGSGVIAEEVEVKVTIPSGVSNGDVINTKMQSKYGIKDVKLTLMISS